MIFTSRTTIDSFFRICEEARIAVPESMKYFCKHGGRCALPAKIYRLPQA
ncbi:MAG: hypothetical protein ACLR8Y_11210 [Alistipes indistinctus]